VARPKPYADAPRLPDGTSLDPVRLFGDAVESVELEIGPGRGWFMIERLQVEPGVGLVGLEIRRKWASIVDERLRRRGLGGRGRVFAEDARRALPRIADASLTVVYVHFPDPWWKKRHFKRLVVSDELLVEVARVLKPGGELFVQTDVAERAGTYQQVVDRTGRFETGPEGACVAQNPYGARSPRERRAVEDGLPVYRLLYRRPAP
jgi:tRNA (guanine-N7-)-methyltransferase